MIRIEPALGNQTVSATRKGALLLDYAQSYILIGENRKILRDYSIFRMQPLGGRLSPIIIEGYWTLPEAINQLKTFENFFDESRDGPHKLQQFVINIEEINSGSEIISIEEPLKFRGILQDYIIILDIKNNRRISYQISFLVHPYDGSNKEIKDIYWLN